MPTFGRSLVAAPEERTVALLFVQHFPYDEHKIFWRFSTLFYQSIVDGKE
jgi:hypothetical protein